jgi:ribonuclease HI
VATVTIYTDGAAKGNPGRGGYGVVLLAPASGPGNGTAGGGIPPHRKELSAGYRLTTNNRMELLAVIVGLEALKRDGCQVTIYSDSRYVVDAVEKGWVFGWERKGFMGKKNPDLWARFLRVYRRHHVRFVWIKGHASIPENERCDALAVAAAESARLSEDTGYDPAGDAVLI